MKRKIDSILLSAGKSSRMGKDKALLWITKERLISHIIRKLLIFSEKIYIVLGDNFEIVHNIIMNEKFPLGKIEFIYNENHKFGMFSSIQKGINTVSGEYPFFLHLIDQPFIPLSVYLKIINQFDNYHLIFKPFCIINGEKKSGHPILLSAKCKKIILQYSYHDNLRDIMKLYLKETKFIKINDNSIFHNINNPDEFKIRIKEYEDGNTCI